MYDSVAGITVTGSNTINVLNLNGLGIVGGISNSTIDGTEWIDFEFDHPSASTQFHVPSAGNNDGDELAGEATIEIFDALDVSLGTLALQGVGTRDLDALFPGITMIQRVRITADVDNHRIGSFTVRPAVCR
ncbi:hypothetical protein KKC22_07805 [Myxococcota bacterium]|nr:hypothetical protein [Myxococcota bacterium]